MSFKQNKSTKYGTLIEDRNKQYLHKVRFYRTASGREPVREWLKQLDPVSRKRIGEDLYTLQLGWPVGMPLARKLTKNLWELRSHVPNGIVRIIFTEKNRELLLLHGFSKKSQKLAKNEMTLANRRLEKIETGEQL